MSQEAVMGLGHQAMWVVVKTAGPIVLAGLIVGVIVGVFQAATQIQEQSLVFVPKVAALMIALGLCGGWIMTHIVDFARGLILSLPNLIR
jgi:flagellar biosynthesis protein FliQ